MSEERQTYEHDVICLGMRITKAKKKAWLFELVHPNGRVSEALLAFKGSREYTLFGLYTIKSPDEWLESYWSTAYPEYKGNGRNRLAAADIDRHTSMHLEAKGFFDEKANANAMTRKAKEHNVVNFGKLDLRDLHDIYNRSNAIGRRALRSMVLQYLETGKS